MPSGKSVSRASSSLPTARPSPSYTIVGVRKPNRGYGKVLLRKPAKEPVRKPAPSGKESVESSGAPLRFKRMVKPPIKGPPLDSSAIVMMSSYPKVLHSHRLVLATKAYVQALERPMIVSPRV